MNLSLGSNNGFLIFELKDLMNTKRRKLLRQIMYHWPNTGLTRIW